jgi:hypothetical protein
MRLGRFIGRRTSLYEHIRAHHSDAGLSEEGQTLADEDEIAGDSDLRWAPGALEGAFSRHAGPEDDEALVADVHAALVELAGLREPARQLTYRGDLSSVGRNHDAPAPSCFYCERWRSMHSRSAA